MLISGVPAWAAPQITGHPAGLPSAAAPPLLSTQVAPLRKTSDSALGESGGRPRQSDMPARSGASGQADPPSRNGPPDPDAHAAPPTILQLRITSILEEQAGVQAKGLTDTNRTSQVETARDPHGGSADKSNVPDNTDRDARRGPLPATADSALAEGTAVQADHAEHARAYVDARRSLVSALAALPAVGAQT